MSQIARRGARRASPAAPRCNLLLAALLVLFACLAGSGCGTTAEQQRLALVKALQQELREQDGFVKVHAVEALIGHGFKQPVADEFQHDLETTEMPYAIGVWRVMARAAATQEEREQFLGRIHEAAWDEAGQYRLHAIESLAKLGAYRKEDRNSIAAYIENSDDATAAFAYWLQSHSGQADDLAALVALLGSDEEIARLRAAYALSRTATLDDDTAGRLEQVADAEPAESAARVYLLSAAVTHGERAHRERRNAELVRYLESGAPNEALEAAHALAVQGDSALLDVLRRNLDADQADARIGAADGALLVLRSQPHSMATIDWLVIAGFMLAMLALGMYYALRTSTRDQYLLGDRRMKPWAVGISYFATIFSTITYLAWPGEIIRHGPMMLAQVAGFPIAVLVVCYFIIPHFMALRVTSAYEVLELRLGLSVRMLGSSLFLLMRLLWMAMIVYTASVEILIPVAGIDRSLAPLVSVAVCVLTIVYTAMGGFKAVVVTDVAQTVIMFAGTIAAMAVITSYFGGLEWLPRRWEPHWQPAVWGYDPNVRISFSSAILAVTLWHICTAGSDQMAIQRYLATRDVSAARRMFTIALVTNAFVLVLLSVLGFSLYAYFSQRPDVLNPGQTIENDADRLFQQFIIAGLPVGMAGLVVAGLLSAAMDSLSSGINSSSSIVTVDFFERFRGRATTSSRMAQLMSWAIGGVVVVLSAGVSLVHGNLLEVTFKVVNLLVAPLFGLFFMALFVRWATPVGTWVGALAGIAVSALISYWQELTGTPGISFIWSMPAALTVQIIVGCAASLLPIGPRARPLLSREAEAI